MNDEIFDQFLDDMTHHLCAEWEKRGGTPIKELETKYGLNDMLTQWFADKRSEEDNEHPV